jgi:hypothetical protein
MPTSTGGVDLWLEAQPFTAFPLASIKYWLDGQAFMGALRMTSTAAAAPGDSSSSGVPVVVQVVTGTAPGSSTASGVGLTVEPVIGTASGESTASRVPLAIRAAVGTAPGEAFASALWGYDGIFEVEDSGNIFEVEGLYNLVTALCKYSADDRTYLFSFQDIEEVEGGDILSSATVTAALAGLTVGTPTISGPFVRVELSSGTPGVTHHVRCVAHTAGGATKEGVGQLVCVPD